MSSAIFQLSVLRSEQYCLYFYLGGALHRIKTVCREVAWQKETQCLLRQRHSFYYYWRWWYTDVAYAGAYAKDFLPVIVYSRNPYIACIGTINLSLLSIDNLSYHIRLCRHLICCNLSSCNWCLGSLIDSDYYSIMFWTHYYFMFCLTIDLNLIWDHRIHFTLFKKSYATLLIYY